MCGILFISSWKSNSKDIGNKLLDLISHRGPDDISSLYFERKGNSIFLGHSRFSLTDNFSGKQPVSNLNKHFVFNGEVFNYGDLANLYSIENFLCDTDVISKLETTAIYKDWWKNANGFWSTILFDEFNLKLEILRDPLGKKPLYYSFDPSMGIIICSEIIPIIKWRKLNQLEVNFDNEIVDIYKKTGKRDFSNKTFYKNIYKFPQGQRSQISLINKNSIINSINSIDNSVLQFNSLYKVEESFVSNKSGEDFLNQFEEIFETAVNNRIHLDEKYKFGLDISGGIDSSCILYALSKKSKSRVYAQYIEEVSNKSTLDRTYINQLKNESDVKINTLYLEDKEIWTDIDKRLIRYEEPVHSYAFVLQQLGWESFKRNNCRTILNGSGADEIFCGYSYYTKSSLLIGRKIESFRYYPLKTLKWLLKGDFFRSNSLIKNISDIKDINNLKIGNIFYGNKLIPPNILRQLDSFNLRIPFWMHAMDKSMMRIPMEVRTPFLDKNLIEFALSLPNEFLLKGKYTKFILRKYLEKKKSSIGKNIKKQGLMPKQGIEWRNKKFFNVDEYMRSCDLNDYFDYKDEYTKANDEMIKWRIFNLSVISNILKI